jgi:endoglycosylceramidase
MTLTDGVPSNPDAGFPLSYFVNPAQNRAWDNFWANRAGPGGVGLQDRFAQGWRHLARRFARVPGVLGYDVLNEPWSGSAWPSCQPAGGCPPGGFDTRLSRFVGRVTKAIREVERRRAVMYEPNLLFDFGSVTRVTPPPDVRAAFAFHSYCTVMAGGSESEACLDQERRTFANALAYAQRSDDALVLGEWGGSSGPVDMARVLELSDRHLMPWLYWWYGAIVRDPSRAPTGANVDRERLRLLVRPYPQRTAGTPTLLRFDPGSRRFTTRFSTTLPNGRSAGTRLTEIFVPRLQYPSGYRVEVRGGSVVGGVGRQRLRVRARPPAHRVMVRLRPH